MRVKDAEEYPVLISRRSLSVFCASMISTYGVMSTPLKLGARLLISKTGEKNYREDIPHAQEHHGTWE